MKKLIYILTAFFLFQQIGNSLYADEVSTPSTTTVGGKTYYLIGTKEELLWFSANVNNGTCDLSNAMLTADINMSGVTTFAPIGNYTHKFQGTFDGQFHKIDNLVVTHDSACGLFGRVYNSTLKRIILGSGCSFTITGNRVNDESNKLYGGVGSIVGYAGKNANSLTTDTISQCGSEAKVISENETDCGGIVGKMGGVITNCWFAGTINASRTTGGIVGSTEAGDYGFVLNSSYEGGKISIVVGKDKKRDRQGTLAGYISNIKNTFKRKTSISGCQVYNDTTSSLDSKKYIFPLVGYNQNSNIVTNCRTHTDSVVRSGYVARILNGGDGKTEKYGSIWGQEIGVDAHPVFITTDNAVYKLVLMDGTTEVRNGYVNSKKLKLPEPTKNGYKFVGWTNKDSSVTYSSTSVITTDDTLYARWKKVYVITLDNEGTTTTMNATNGDFTLPTPTKDDYTFIGWMNKDSSAFSAASILTSDTVIYANWKQLQFNITLKDGLNGDSLIKGASNGNFKLPVRSHNDYTFIGWMSKDSSAFSEASILTSDTVIYANWKQLQFNITLKDGLNGDSLIKGASNGNFKLPVRKHNDYTFIGWMNKDSSAFSEANILTSDTVIYANWKQLQFNITLKDGLNGDSLIKGASNGNFKLPVRKHNDYTFIGWMNKDSSAFSEANILTSDTVIYANWKQLQFNITLKDGLNGDSLIKGASNGNFKLPVRKHNDYTFIGWMSKDSSAFSEASILTSDTVIYANWKQLQFNITLKDGLNGDSLIKGASNGKFKLPVRKHDDYTFIGWMNKDSSAFSEASILTSDTVIYANWKQLQFNITLKDGLNGDSLIKGASNGKFTLPVRKHDDYTFIGWMSKDSSAFSEASILTSDTVIYANWKQLQFNITLKDGLNGDSLIKGASNGNFKLPVRSHNDYTFIGWMSKDSSAFSEASILTSDTVIYANWKQLQFNITLKDGLNGDSLIKGASNGNFKLPVRKHDDYTFIGWKNKAGKTFTDKDILTSDTTLVAVWKQLQFDITLKDSFQTDSVIKGASNGKFSLPVRSHNDYTFIGWKNMDGKTFTAKDILTSDTTLVAVWKQLQFNITLKDSFQTDSVIKGASNGKFSLPVRSHNDYTFIGWKNMDGKTFTAKDILTSDTTLVAVWKQLQFDITLKDSFQTDSVIKGASNGKFTLPVRSHNDYTFIGWKNMDGKTFTAKDILTSDTTLVAVWKQLQFDITLKDSFQTDSVIKGASNGKFSLPVRSHNDYTFIGWKNMAGKTFTDKDILTSDTTLVAVWKQLQFDITLKDSFQTDSVIKGASNGKFSLPVRSHNDYTFIGWKNMDGKTFTAKDILTSDTTLVAVWKQLQFDITLKDSFQTDSVIKGASNGKFSLPVRSHNDYTFIGWKNMAGKTFTDKDILTSDTTLVAVWKQLQFDITLKDSFQTDSVIKGASNGKFSLPVRSHNDYTFIGWKNKAGITFTKDNILTSDTTLVAVWKQLQFDITLKDSFQTDSVIKGASNGKFSLPVRSHNDYTFIGWKNMAGITFTKDNILTSDTTLVAVWKQLQFDITLKDSFQTDSVIKGASNGKFSLPVRNHNDYTFIGWKNKAGVTFTKDNILTSDTTLIAVWKQLQFDITLKDTFQTDSTIIGASNGKFTLPVRSHNDYTFIGWKNMEGKTFTKDNILTSDTTLVAVWKQLQFDITLKDSFQTDSVIKGASNGKFSLPVRSHNDYTFIGWKNMDGKTFTAKDILTSDTTLVAIWKQLQFDITLKDSFQTDSTIIGASNGKFSLPVRSHNDYTFIGWKNKDGKTFTKDNILTSDTTLVAVWKQLQFDITLKDSFQTDSVIKGASNGKFSLPVRSHNDYTFIGWKNMDGKTFTAKDILTSDTTLVAVWKQLQFNITLKDSFQTDSVIKGASNGKFSLPVRSHNDFTFIGWKNMDGKTFTAKDILTSDTTLVAVWKQLQFDITLKDSFQTDSVIKGASNGKFSLPVRSHNDYTFIGWKNMDGKTFTAKDILTSDTTLVAVWKQLQFNITLKDSFQTDSVIKGASNGKFSLPVRSHNDYTFIGWKNKDGKTFTAKDILTSDTTLVAVWKQLQFNITLKDSFQTDSTIIGASNGKFSLPVRSHNDYTFIGWKNNAGKTFTDKDILTSDTTLIAVWKQLQFDITLKDSFQTDSVIKGASNGKFTLPVRSHNDYTFIGWKNMDGKSFTKDNILTSDTTLVAVWKQLQFDITLKDSFQTDSVIKGASNGKFSLPVRSHNDYTFIGWKNKDGKTFTKDNILTSDTTLVAVWKQLQFNITLKDSFQTDSVIKGASNEKFSLPVRSHNDYTFIGWKNMDGKTFTAKDILTSDTTLVAVWKQLQFDITLKDSFQTDSVIKGASNGKFTLPVRSHNDYTFIGWKNMDGKSFTAKDILTSDTTLVAVWKQLQFNITLKDSFQTDSTIIGASNGKFSLPVRSHNDYTFIGWKNMDGKTFTDKDILTSDTTLVAVWKQLQFDITLKDSFQTDSTIIGASNGKFSLPVRSHNDYTFIGWKNMDGKTFTDKDILTSDTTLVAVWKQLQFDITLKDSFQTDSVIKGASNGKFSLPVRSHNDYTFIGWKNMDGKSFTAKDILTSDTTLVAVWEQLQFNITLINAGKDTSKMRVSNGKYTLPTPTKYNYTLLGWMNKDSVAFSTNSELTKDTILYANWKIKEYTITLVYGGATTRMTVSNGDYELPVPTKFDYKFVRWTNKDSITFTIADTLTSDTTLYAQWVQKVYIITLVDGNDTTHMTASNSKYTLPTPTKADYTFIRWSNKEGIRFTTQNVLTSDTTLYAQWSQLEFTLTLINEGDTIRKVVSNGKYTLPTPSKTDYTFLGWADKNGNTFTTSNTLTSDTTLTAQWEQLEFNITMVNENDTTYMKASNGKYTLPTPTRATYAFMGWADKNGNTFTTASKLTKDTTLIAQWKQLLFTITLINGTDTTRMKASNGNYTLPTPTKSDYRFIGWANRQGVEFTTDNILSSDTTLLAQWKQLEYTITLVNVNDTTRMTASNGHYTLPTPTRFDYTFMGWADKNGKTFTTDNILSSDTTLTAQWKQLEFNITLINGNDTTHMTVSNGHYTLPTPTKEAYAFAGWASKKGITFSATSVLSSDTTLMAQWKQVIFTITMVTENDTTRMTVSNDKSYTLPTPKRFDYTFVRWANADNVTFKTDGTLTSDTTIYAIWKQLTHTITLFDGTSTTIMKVSNGNYVLPTATKDDYIFNGWANADSIPFTTDSVLTSDTTLYAVWKQKVYTITFEDGDTSYTMKASNGKFTLPIPTKFDYIFAGWTNKKGAQFTNSSILSKDTTLFAHWTQLKFTITLVDGATINKVVTSNGHISLPAANKNDYWFVGWVNKDSIPFTNESILTSDTTIYAVWKQKVFTITLVNGDSISKMSASNGHFTLPTPTQTDYQMTGWTNINGKPFTNSSTLTSDTTIYAQWKQKQYTVTLVYGGATTKLTVSNGNYTLPTPTKADHIFTGWYNKDSVQFIPGTTLTQDTILYAHWNQLRFTITFIDGDSIRKVTVSNGHYVLPNPSKFDYQFEGWANEDGETFDAASILTSDTILYAQWKQHVYTITLVDGESTTKMEASNGHFTLPEPFVQKREFRGWINKDSVAFTNDSLLTSDTTLYANWFIFPSKIYVTGQNGVIRIGGTDAEARIYTGNGSLFYQGYRREIAAENDVYIVIVRGEKHKVVVRR